MFKHAIGIVLCLAQLVDSLLILEDIDSDLAIVLVMLVNQCSLLIVFASQMFAAFLVLEVDLTTPCLAARS